MPLTGVSTIVECLSSSKSLSSFSSRLRINHEEVRLYINSYCQYGPQTLSAWLTAELQHFQQLKDTAFSNVQLSTFFLLAICNQTLESWIGYVRSNRASIEKRAVNL